MLTIDHTCQVSLFGRDPPYFKTLIPLTPYLPISSLFQPQLTVSVYTVQETSYMLVILDKISFCLGLPLPILQNPNPPCVCLSTSCLDQDASGPGGVTTP